MFNFLLIIIYLAFISLGLPDSLLGAAWPTMYPQFDVPVSYAGMISMIIAVGTIVSSLQSDRLGKRFGTGKITAVSVAITAIAMLGFAMSDSFWALCLWAIPYGLGAGSVDAALNNYVALHYRSSHMSWLHCMWGVGTIISPNIMGRVLVGGGRWNDGYLCIAVMQLVLTVVLFATLFLWKSGTEEASPEKSVPEKATNTEALSFRKILQIKGAKEVMVTFFCYCALEQTTMLWASSYMVLHNGISSERAAAYASLFFIGITAGRAVNGFLSLKFSDKQTIRSGQLLILIGIMVLLMPLGNVVTIVGLIIVGLGCAPIYPGIIHSTPEHFGKDKSQALIGVQMASAYMGTCLMPPLFGWIAEHISVNLLSVYLLVLLILMVVMHEMLMKKTAQKKENCP